MEVSQEQHKQQTDKKFRKASDLNIGDKVWVKYHRHSQASKNRKSKFMPKRDGPYIISSQRSPVSFTLTANDDFTPIDTYHVSSLHHMLDLKPLHWIPCEADDSPRRRFQLYSQRLLQPYKDHDNTWENDGLSQPGNSHPERQAVYRGRRI